MADQSDHAWGAKDDVEKGGDVAGRAEGESVTFRAHGHIIQLQHALQVGSGGDVLISRQLNNQHSQGEFCCCGAAKCVYN